MIGAIVGHLFGDYIIQNDWMALNKKKHWFPLWVHCSLWTLSVTMFGGMIADWRVTTVLCVTHLIQDGTPIVRKWMSLIGQEQFASGPLSPWSIIVVDNVLHIVTIFAVWKIFEL